MKYKQKIKIFTVTHKKFELPEKYQSNIYIPIQVGSDLNENMGYISDNTYDNISLKNKNYCELTGLYWIWKNDKSDITGIVHYRRFFKNDNNIFSNKLLSEVNILKYLENYDVIVPREWIYKESLYDQYKNNHNIKDLENCKAVIKDIYPEYLADFNKVINSNSAHLYNMIICKKSILDEYCKWLFNILFRLEEQLDISDYDDYQKRVFGFLSERLLNVWIVHNKLKTKELDIIKTENSKFKNISCDIKLRIKKILNKK